MNARLLASQLIRAAISPARLQRPTLAERARHSVEILPPARRVAPSERPAREWFAELEEHFPRAYLHAYASDLDQLRTLSSCTPGEAAAYARIYLLAPVIA